MTLLLAISGVTDPPVSIINKSARPTPQNRQKKIRQNNLLCIFLVAHTHTQKSHFPTCNFQVTHSTTCPDCLSTCSLQPAASSTIPGWLEGNVRTYASGLCDWLAGWVPNNKQINLYGAAASSTFQVPNIFFPLSDALPCSISIKKLRKIKNRPFPGPPENPCSVCSLQRQYLHLPLSAQT